MNQLQVKEPAFQHSPTLKTVFMIEEVLKKSGELLSIDELKRKLPKQVMHQTLSVILEYLWKSGKIIYGPRGMQWIYTEPEHLRRMLKNSVEM